MAVQVRAVQVRAFVRAGLMRRTSLQSEGAWLLSVDNKPALFFYIFFNSLGVNTVGPRTTK